MPLTYCYFRYCWLMGLLLLLLLVGVVRTLCILVVVLVRSLLLLVLMLIMVLLLVDRASMNLIVVLMVDSLMFVRFHWLLVYSVEVDTLFLDFQIRQYYIIQRVVKVDPASAGMLDLSLIFFFFFFVTRHTFFSSPFLSF